MKSYLCAAILACAFHPGSAAAQQQQIPVAIPVKSNAEQQAQPTVSIAIPPLSGGQRAPAPAVAVATPIAELAPNYLVSPNDLIQVKVFREDDLESTARVTLEGTITFPLIGVVKIGGKTPHEAAQVIQDALAKDYLVSPQVTVNVIECAKRRFTILGQVHTPGTYEMPERLGVTLLQAVGMAGGYTRIADAGNIILKRQTNGRESVFKLNGKQMAAKPTGQFEIQPGDIITVGESLF